MYSIILPVLSTMWCVVYRSLNDHYYIKCTLPFTQYIVSTLPFTQHLNFIQNANEASKCFLSLQKTSSTMPDPPPLPPITWVINFQSTGPLGQCFL